MTMGDRIKTRQQLLDQEADAADSGTSSDDDRHDESIHPDQAHDSIGQHVSQEGVEVPGGVDALRQELAQLNERMAVIKQEAAVEVDRKWVSPWRTPEVFDIKVKTRLTSHDEYRSLQDRVRDAKASLVKFDAAAEAGTAK
jgi:hypothetical protein